MAVPAVVLAVFAKSYADFTEFGVAAFVVDVLDVESSNCTAPTTLVVAAATEITGAVPPVEEIAPVPATEATLPAARSYALLTLFGVAAFVVDVDEVESSSCTAPLCVVLAASMETVAVPLVVEALIGEVPTTTVAVPPPPV
jgi:hypothetical protein